MGRSLHKSTIDYSSTGTVVRNKKKNVNVTITKIIGTTENNYFFK